jgi:hypothetical protein
MVQMVKKGFWKYGLQKRAYMWLGHTISMVAHGISIQQTNVLCIIPPPPPACFLGTWAPLLTPICIDVVHMANLDDPNAIEGIMSFATRNLCLLVLNDYIYDFNHKVLLWILYVKSHSHILVGHVTNRWWSGNKMEGVNFHHFYFIYIAYMTIDKVTWMSNCHYNVLKMNTTHLIWT